MKKHVLLALIFTSMFLTGCISEPENLSPTVIIECLTTYGKAPLDVQFDSEIQDPDGTIISFRWDFGDGITSTQKTPTHTYNATGTFFVTLTATDDQGEIATHTIPITVIENNPPHLQTSVDTTYGKAPLNVTFTATATDIDGSIKMIQWDFGDGNSSNEHTTSHTFTQEGTYLVRCIVGDDEHAIQIDTHLITVTENIPPIIHSINASSTSILIAPFTISAFTCDVEDIDGQIVSYQWEFDEGAPWHLRGSNSSEKNASYRYWGGGRHVVTLTITDDDGATDTAHIPVTVSISPLDELYNFVYGKLSSYAQEFIMSLLQPIIDESELLSQFFS